MKNFSLIVLTFFVSAAAFAQRSTSIEQEAARISFQLQRDGRYLAPSQREQIARHLESIDRILEGGGQGRNEGGEYTCVSRDNDGRSPYVLGIREGVQITRLKGETFKSEQSCKDTLASARNFARSTIMCVSKDNDGRSPYQLALLNGTAISRIARTVSGDFQSCQLTLRALRSVRDQAVFCTSRDNDGRSPFVAVDLNVTTGATQVGSETFQDLMSCQRFLGQ